VISEQVRATRQKIVLDHFRDEVAQRWDDVLSTFPHPRYEIVPTQTVNDGDGAVRGYYEETRIAFPDQRHELIAERVDFDQLSLLRQLLSGIDLRSPKGVLLLVRVLAGFARLSRRPRQVIPDGDEETVAAAGTFRG
jgi:hypothetical protein